jgi:hypothetical protein
MEFNTYLGFTYMADSKQIFVGPTLAKNFRTPIPQLADGRLKLRTC